TGGVASQKPGKHGGTAVSAGGATVWDARTGEALVELKGFEEGVNSGAFSPDGTRIVTGPLQDLQDGGTELKVWDARTGAVLLDLTDPPPEGGGGVFVNLRGGSVAFSPDGTRLLTAGVRDKKDPLGRAVVRDARTGAVLAELQRVGHVLRAAFNPDGTGGGSAPAAGGRSRCGTPGRGRRPSRPS